MDDLETDEDCFVIHFQGDKSDPPGTSFGIPCLKPSLEVPHGEELRYRAYAEIWERLSARCLQTVKRLNEELAEELATFVNDAYDYTVFGAPPLAVIPTAVVIGNSSESQTRLFEQVAAKDNVYVSRLHAKDCTNLTNTMKSLVLGFLGSVIEDEDEEGNGPKVGRSSAPTLAAYDLNLLEAWYRSVKPRRGNGSDGTKLLVCIHEVEALDPSILEDMIYICNLHVPALPFMFVIEVSTSITYLHQSLTRASLTSLEITPLHARGGEHLLEDVVESVFFDPTFEPGIMAGALPLDLLMTAYKERAGSLDRVLLTLQLLLLRHFSLPLSTFFTNPRKGDRVEGQEALDHLRLKSLRGIERFSTMLKANEELDSVWTTTVQKVASGDDMDLISAVGDFKNVFFDYARGFRIATSVMRTAHAFFTALGLVKTEFLDVCILLLEGSETNVYVDNISGKVKKCSIEELQDLLNGIVEYISGLEDVGYGVPELLEHATMFLEELEEERQETQDGRLPSSQKMDLSNRDAPIFASKRSRHADEVAEMLMEYWQTWLRPLDHLPLHEIWFLGAPSAKSVEETLDPSIQSSLVSALLRPHEYLQCSCCGTGSTHTLPDESIAFIRYLNSGKMVNVYDWFETFTLGLESEVTEKESPKKGRRKAKENEDTEAKEEARRNELQARFLRCFHEFDMLGLLRATSRKPDHALRTVYEIAD